MSRAKNAVDAVLDRYAVECGHCDYGLLTNCACPPDPRAGLMAMANALYSIVYQHLPQAWYEECMDSECETDEDGHHYVEGLGGEFLVCEKSRVADRCDSCTPDGADDLEVASVPWPCPTLTTITDVLENAR